MPYASIKNVEEMALTDLSGEYAIYTEDLTKIFRRKSGDVTALDSISLRIRSGEFFGLLGPNGAGKTTFIKILCTLVLPTSGKARVNGFDVVKHPNQVRESIGWLHGETGGRALYWRLSARDNLRFYAALQNVPRSLARKRIEELLDFFKLSDQGDRMVKDFSTGMKVKLMMARCLLPNPPIFLLDEPTAGLDATTASETRNMLRELNRELGKTIVFTSHNLHEVEQLCRRVAIIKEGRIIAEGSVEELGSLIQNVKSVEVRLRNCDPEEARTALKSLDVTQKIVSVSQDEQNINIRIEVRDEDEAIPRIANVLGSRGFPLLSIQRVRPNLEEIFVKITKRE